MSTRLAISVFFLAFIKQVAAQPAAEPYVSIPSTISEEAQTHLRMLPDPHLQRYRLVRTDEREIEPPTALPRQRSER